jgi:ATP-dependent RNA helicase RhlE
MPAPSSDYRDSRMPDSSPFTALGLSAPLVRATAESSYIEPTAIQQLAIPAVLRGVDVLAAAQTGSGKTAAFALPMLQRLSALPSDSARNVTALILVPTRELAMQVSQFMQTYSRYLPERLKILSVFGGVSINPQMLALRGGADVVIATPGRLLDLLDHNALHLSGVRMLVLDEADRLLDLGFADELQRIVALLPTARQTLLFSATFPDEVQTLADTLLREPVRLSVATDEQTAPDIQQRAIRVDMSKRTPLLRHLIQTEQWPRVLVFVATKYATEHVAEKLRRVNIQAEALHGELSQGARTQALSDFKASKIQVLVATDVAARGIDIVQLPAVVNYDLPRSAVDYTHRIGRTGRAGESGIAVNFITADAEAHFRLIEKRHQLRLPREVLAGFEPEDAEVVTTADDEMPEPAKPTGGIKGKRKSKKDKLREAAARSAGALADAAPILKGADIWARRKPESR